MSAAVHPSDRHLIRLTNCFLIEPETGDLTELPATLWVDQQTGTIAHVKLGDSSMTSDFGFGLAAGERSGEEILSSAPSIDLGGHILAPGMIDVQINGAYGADFSHWPGEEPAYVRAVEKASARLVETGVTAFVPTVISQTSDMYSQIVPALHRLAANPAPIGRRLICQTIGYHLEGPFLSPAKIGCHPTENARTVPEGWRSMIGAYGQAIVEPAQESMVAKIVTLAPEVLGVMDCVPRLVEEGFTVSIGHSGADTLQAAQAVSQGASLITHLFNAMPAFHHREPGIIGLLGASPGSRELGTVGKTHPSQILQSAMTTPTASAPSKWVEATTAPSPTNLPETELETSTQSANGFRRPFWSCIVDGLHVHPFAVNLAYQAHPQGCILVTDAVSWMDPKLPDGIYPWRSQDHTVTKKGDSITLTDTDTLAGAAVPLDKCVRNLARFCGIPLSRAIHCATRNPARCLGGKVAERKGALRVGYDADFTVWNKDTGEVLSTWIAGQQVFGDFEVC